MPDSFLKDIGLGRGSIDFYTLHPDNCLLQDERKR
jgi:hypothetical protein